jgi:hypothetical protein
VSALHDGGDVEARVRRLVGSTAEVSRPAAGTSAAMAAVVAAGVILAVAGQSLPAVHGMIEAAVRLLALAG